jgi:hypothetical protein
MSDKLLSEYPFQLPARLPHRRYCRNAHRPLRTHVLLGELDRRRHIFNCQIIDFSRKPAASHAALTKDKKAYMFVNCTLYCGIFA